MPPAGSHPTPLMPARADQPGGGGGDEIRASRRPVAASQTDKPPCDPTASRRPSGE